MILKQFAYMGNIFVRGKFYFKSLCPSVYKCPVKVSDKHVENIHKVSQYLKTTKGSIHNIDYKHILRKAKKGDFVFLDPPYIEEHKYDFKYNKNEDLSKIVNELRIEVEKLDAKGVKWLMTQADTKLIRDTFKNYNITTFNVFRPHTKIHKQELIIKNY